MYGLIQYIGYLIMKNIKQKTLSQQEIVFGIHPIIELLSAKKRTVYAIYTTKPTPKAWHSIEALLPQKTIVHFVTRSMLDKLAATDDHQNIVACVKPLSLRKTPFEPTKHPFVLLLDGIQDTRNIGAILRSAYCTNVSGVVIPLKQSAPLSGATYKSSAGLAEHLEIYQPASAVHAALELKKAGYHLYMAALGGENALEITYAKPICLVIGNESTGISSDVLALGKKVMLPQKNADISYNASVAAGILLLHIAHTMKLL